MTFKTWKKFARFFSDSKRLLAASFVVSVGQSLLLVPVPLLVKGLFDHKVPDGDTGAILLAGLGVLGLYVASAALGLWTRYSTVKATKIAVARLRCDLLERMYELPRAYFDQRSLGQLHSTIVHDSERVEVMSTMLVGVLLPSVIVGLGMCVILGILNVVLLLVLAGVVPVMLLLARWLGRTVRVRTRTWQQEFDTFSSQTQLALRAITLTKVHAAASTELEQRQGQVAQLRDAGREMSWVQAAWGILQNAVAASAGVVVLIVGGIAVARGSMSVGELLSFYAVLALLLRQLTPALAAAPLALAGYESFARLEAILESPEPEPYSGARSLRFRGALTVEEASFDYGREPLLGQVSMEVEPGEFVALVGPNGAGKSTLLSLILGLYRPHEGRLLADGVPYDELDIQALRRQMGVILQDPIVFPTTIRENIAYGRPGATSWEIERAARWGTAADWIESLPQRYETQIGDEGNLLSGGERQRIALARALLSEPALLVLDEPTTYLDETSIRHLLENLRELPGRPTVLAISHDDVIAQEADRVYALRDGRIVPSVQTGERSASVAAVRPARA